MYIHRIYVEIRTCILTSIRHRAYSPWVIHHWNPAHSAYVVVVTWSVKLVFWYCRHACKKHTRIGQCRCSDRCRFLSVKVACILIVRRYVLIDLMGCWLFAGCFLNCFVDCWLVAYMVRFVVFWLIGRLIDWYIACLIWWFGYLVAWLFDCRVECAVYGLIDGLSVCLVGGLVGWVDMCAWCVDRLFGWVVFRDGLSVSIDNNSTAAKLTTSQVK